MAIPAKCCAIELQISSDELQRTKLVKKRQHNIKVYLLKKANKNSNK